MSSEAKVGLLAVFFVVLAVSTAVFLTDALGRVGARYVTVQFENAQGLEPGAQARLGGVFIGRVVDVALAPDPKFPSKPAAVKIQIHRDVLLYDTDTFEIKQGAVVGDKYIAVTRAAKDKGRTQLESGTVVEGAGATSAEVVMDEIQTLIAAAQLAVDSVGAMTSDPQTQRDVKEILSNINQATARSVIVAEQAIELAATLNRSGQMGEARLAQLMTHLVGAADSVETMAARVDTMLEVSPVPAQLAMAGENVRQASEDVAALVALTRETVEDEDMQGQMAQVVSNLTESSENVRVATENMAAISGDEELMDDVRQTLENVREASGSLRTAAEAAENLITEDETQEDLRATISNFRDVSETSAVTIGRADSIMDNIDTTMESMRRTQGMLSDIQVAPIMQVRGADGGLRADAYLDLRLTPGSRDTWRVGMRDVGATEKLDVLWCHPIGQDIFRAGIIGSDIGVAYEYSLGGARAIEAELYDPDDLRLDIGFRWGMWKNYFLLLGAQNIAEDTDPYLGVRYQRGF